MTESLIVVMGARLKADGTASRALLRRVARAIDVGRKFENARYIVTGGNPRGGRSEAAAMREVLLAHGVGDDRIIVEQNSRDTLQSVVNCTRLIRSLGRPRSVIVCTDRYHLTRCRLLFRLAGIETEYAKMPNPRADAGLWRSLYYYLREAAAVPWDVFLIALWHRRLRSDG